ncbi:MAG: YegS/Rv2252/BmrU family lipid kinase [Gemmataceae bacterium]
MKPSVGRTCLLVNHRAGTAAQLAGMLDRLTELGVEVRELAEGDDLAALVRAAADEGFETVAVAGGDGSVQAAANGLATAGRRTTLAVLPLGTGNDFCRTMAIPLDPLAAAELLLAGVPRDVDVLRVEGGEREYLINAATGGFSGKVAAEVTSELKAVWGPLAYLRGALGPVTDPPTYHLTVRFDDGPPERHDVLNVVVANARSAAGGFVVAPGANPEDGLLDVVFVHAADALDLSVVAARLMHGDYTHDENVTHRRARTVAIEAHPPLPMSLDGERCECRRVRFSVVPKAVRVLVGPGYQPEPVRESPVEEDGIEELPEAANRRVASRMFGFITALLLLAKRTLGWAAAGFGIAAVAVAVFAWVARGVNANEWRAWDTSVSNAVHAGANPSLDRVAALATWPGDASGTAVLTIGCLGGFLWRKHYLTAAAFGAVLGGVVVLESLLKPLFGIARPDLFPRSVEADGFSFPSGHALRGVGLYGFLAALSVIRGWEQKRPGWWLVALACSGIAAGVCWSRVYLGVHWPTDVIAGALAAGAWVAACLVARRYAADRTKRPRTA